jgi:hypothetical protein
MGAWSMWSVADGEDLGDEVWIQYPSLKVTNMREVFRAAFGALVDSGKL